MSFEKFLDRISGKKEEKVKTVEPATKEQAATTVEPETKEDAPSPDVSKDDVEISYEDMTKKELEAYALKEHEIQLDHKQSKSKMLDQFKSKLDTKKEK